MGFTNRFKKMFKSEEKEKAEEQKVIISTDPIKNKVNNFKYLENLIRSQGRDVLLDSDIILEDGEELQYADGIELDIDRLVLDASDYVIDGRGKSRIFSIPSDVEVKLVNVSIKNGYHPDGGGAIKNAGNLTLDDCNFKKCASDEGKGGAIYNEEELVAGNCVFENNSARYGGAIYDEDAGTTVAACGFVMNKAERGGAISNKGYLSISESSDFCSTLSDFFFADSFYDDLVLIRNLNGNSFRFRIFYPESIYCHSSDLLIFYGAIAVIGLCFGPCLVCGVYESACGGLFTENGFAWHILMLGFAIGMFVTNILYTHSFVERHVDEVSHKKTLAVLLKTDAAGLTAYAIFLFVPFMLVIGCVVAGYIHWAYSLVLLMLPRAIWVMWAMVMFAKKVEVPTDNPPRWLGPMDNWDKIEQDNRYYLMRWYAMRNVNTGFCLIMAVVKITLYIISIVG